MIAKVIAPGGGPGAAVRRDAEALPLTVYNTSKLQGSQVCPRTWWAMRFGFGCELRNYGAMAIRQAFWDARRAMLLVQSERYGRYGRREEVAR